MTKKNPHERYDDELLSAYVDGELTPAERAAVEKRLSDDPQAQAMVAELRAVCETLQSLPKQELGADLRESVLRQAVVLAEPGPAAVGGARRWAWAAMALAAALLLAVYLPEADHDGQQVAQVASDQPGVATTSASSAPLSGSMNLLERGGLRAEANEMVQSDRVTLGTKFDGTLRRTPIEMPYLQPIGEVISEDYHVHLTPVDQSVGLDQFDQILAIHGIKVRDPSHFGTARKTTDAGEPSANSTELVLVEAPLEQIQQVIDSCGRDDSHWKLPRPVDQPGANSNSPLFARLRSEAATPSQAGDAGELDETQPSDAPARGWARHLGQRRLSAGDLLSNEGASSAGQTSPTLRVLFVLHPAAE